MYLKLGQARTNPVQYVAYPFSGRPGIIGPMSPPRSIRIATLGDLRDHDHRLYAWCECGRQGYLDLDTLIARCGPDRSFLKGHLRIRCTVCGERVDYHLHAPVSGYG
ncbi:hypothetical protein [Amorphus orientalis]|uniref:DNA-directed RNA polymerase subunit RPC12/RpoP n=1 Tax=Amorphus orientalis TaxID=649198 RepID=A0AAE4AS54_9HYPH|nr:hypothetical protein [Amorphus orientalis]MDQ0314878.1 DNA-directed RNA polymerase subunit RPC12/RpoP [Amorphus orientalis]